ncbi:MAG: FYDLN acid domain-containing protein [Pseudomonadota bacterium]|nr:FYDLN acid domain-containing protein [Pseudomonadota bacterium]
MENFEKGAKRKCTKCNTLFFDFGKSPIVCPSCGADVNSLLTNVSRRGRPPKNTKPELQVETKEAKIEEIVVNENVEDVEDVEDVVENDDVVSDDSSVEEIVEIEREQDS